VLKKKILANFQRILEHFTPKIVTKLSKIWVWDPGSRIRDPGSGKNLPDPRSRGEKGTGSRIRIRNTYLGRKKLVMIVVDLHSLELDIYFSLNANCWVQKTGTSGF
jgi:hypothetical protein